MIEGGCLCGGVRFRIDGEPLMSGRCCCRACQKLSGGGNSENIAFAETAFAIEGETADYHWTADSGGAVTTTFCPRCGSPLFGRSTSTPGLKIVRAGALDDPGLYTPQMMVYAKRRHPWVQHDAALPAFDTMPPMMGGG
jgi:hypothetical protein